MYSFTQHVSLLFSAHSYKRSWETTKNAVALNKQNKFLNNERISSTINHFFLYFREYK